MVSQAIDYSVGDASKLGSLAIQMLLTAATRTKYPEHLAGLDPFISTPYQAYCYDYLSRWLHSEDNLRLYEVARYAEEEARLPLCFVKLSVPDIVDTEYLPCCNLTLDILADDLSTDAGIRDKVLKCSFSQCCPEI